MSIIGQPIIVVTPLDSQSIKVSEEHVDHLGRRYLLGYRADITHDTVGAGTQHAITINQQTVDKEVSLAIADYEQGNDPLHFDAGGWWEKIVPDYQTWDDLATAVTINFLSREDQLELVYIETTIIRISTADKKLLWGMTTAEVGDVNSDIQNAINTKTVLDTYIPPFIDGVKV